MGRSALAQFVLTAVAGVLAATLISWQGAVPTVTRAVAGGPFEGGARSLRLRAEFAGPTEDGESLRWRSAADPASPAISLWLRPLASREHSADPLWLVVGHLETESATRRSVTAELAGTIDWARGVLTLDGGGSGASVGERVRLDARIVDFDVHGVVLLERDGPIALHALLR
jgi:hypothetical protein